MGERACAGCGVQFELGERERNPRKWCSEACRVRTYAQNSPAYRARQAELAAHRHAETYVPTSYELVCATCTAVFTARRRNTKYCSLQCRARSDYLGRYGRRRGVQREPYKFGEIAERDQWRCGICLETVDRKLRYPDSMAGSVDHILPLSRGGADTSANIQLAHLICNWRKNDRVVQPDMGIPDMGGNDGRQRAST